MVGGVFVSWIHHHGRSESVAEALGLEPVFLGGRPGRPWSVPLRYLRQGARTVALLRDRRPEVVVAMAPPLPLVGLLLAVRGRRRIPAFTLVVDAHTKAVLGRGGRRKRLFPHLAARADLVLVAAPSLVEPLVSRDVDVVHLHDPLPPQAAGSTGPPFDSPCPGGAGPDEVVALFPATWSADEPVEALVAAAARVPGIRLVVTGRVPEGRRPTPLPENVELSGFLPRDAYDRLLERADVVLALTTREHTMQRAGYEGLALGKPLVVSDTAALRAFFDGAALAAAATADALAVALSRCTDPDERHRLAAASARRRSAVLVEEAAALAAVRARLGVVRLEEDRSR